MTAPPERLLIFDLDGVITTEQIYWECARLTIWELMQVHHRIVDGYVPAVHDVLAREQIIPQDLIYIIKNRAVNSNWDLTFLVACGLLLALPAQTGAGAESLEDWWGRLAMHRLEDNWRSPVEVLLSELGAAAGQQLMRDAGKRVARHHGVPGEWLAPEGQLWQQLYQRFQMWYGGQSMGAWGAVRLPEVPVVPIPELREVLGSLAVHGYTLGIVTGRPLDEALYALETFGIAAWFEQSRTVTIDTVIEAQQHLGRSGLGKPHPYPIRKVIAPSLSHESLADGVELPMLDVLMIGDSTSDALAAASAGIQCVGVTSGVIGNAARDERRTALLDAGCVTVLDDIRALPAWLGS